MIRKRTFLSLLIFLFFSTIKAQSKIIKPPNILIIIADDATYNELPLYGGVNVKTPEINQVKIEAKINCL